MKKGLKQKISRERKQYVLHNFNAKFVSDEPLTNSLANKIFTGVRLSHYSSYYELWFEDNKNLVENTWLSTEKHDSGYLSYVAKLDNDHVAGSHKNYHKLNQKYIYDEIRVKLLYSTSPKKLPINFRGGGSTFAKLDNKKYLRVMKVLTYNTKNNPTIGYYVYHTNGTTLSEDLLIVV